MKNICIAFLFIVCVSKTNGQTNVYHPFPQDSATWRFDYYNGSCSGYCYSFTNIMKGDTSFGSFSYKVFENNAGAFRQDITSKRVYFYDFSTNSEALLYDFNLSIGDTIPQFWLGNSYADIIIVQSKDSIIVNGQWRNLYVLNNQNFNYQISLIEGVGTTAGVTTIFRPCICAIILTCFKGDGTLQFSHFSPYSNCNNLMAISQHKLDESIFILPNPTTGQFNVSLPEDNAVISITNIFGQLIFKTHSTQKTVTLNLDRNGIYLVNIQTSNLTTTQKLIVNR